MNNIKDNINSLFESFYYGFILNLLIFLIVLILISIVIIPFLLIEDEIIVFFTQNAENNEDILISELIKYKTVMYKWCNLDNFKNLNSFFNYKFYTPVVLIYYASILIYFTFIILAFQYFLSLLSAVDMNSFYENKKNNILLFVIIFIFSLWLIIYIAFNKFILQFANKSFEYNNNIDDTIDKIINNTTIFPDDEDKKELFKKIILDKNHPKDHIIKYYQNLVSKFTKEDEYAKFIVLYIILQYINDVSTRINSKKYKDDINTYLLNPLNSKFLFAGFNLENYNLKDFYLSKIKTENIIDHLFKNDQYLDKLKSQDTNFITKIKIEYDRLLEKDIFKNLEETNRNIEYIQPHVYAIFILIIIMIIIYISVYLFKNPEIINKFGNSIKQSIATVASTDLMNNINKKNQENKDLVEDQENRDPEKDQEDGDLVEDQENRDLVEDQENRDLVENQEDGDPEKDKKDGDPEKDQEDGDPEKDKKDGDPVEDQEDGDPVKDKKDGDPEKDKKDGDPEKDKKDGDPEKDKK